MATSEARGAPKPGSPGEWVSGPGAFRLLLAMLVLLSHATRLQLGKTAVLVFFVLSGYWITVMWRHRYSRATRPYLTYVVSRSWRLLPTFWLVSAVTLGGYWLLGQVPPGRGPHDILSNLFLFGYNKLDFKPIDAAWSLDIEMQFYLLAPFLITLCALRNGRYWWATIGACVLVSLLTWKDSQDTILQCVGFFAIGMASAVTQWVPRKRFAIGSAIFFWLFIAALVLSPWRGALLGGKGLNPLYIEYNMRLEILLALMATPWAIFTTRQRGGAADHMLGDFSYILYLIHMQILIVLGEAAGSMVHRLGMLGASILLSLTGCWLIWRYFDHPINEMRAQWVSRRLRGKPG